MLQNLKKHPHRFDIYLVNVKSKQVIFFFSNFVALSEYIDFNYKKCMTSKLPNFTIPNQPKSHIPFYKIEVFREAHKNLTLLNWYIALWTSQNI